MTSIAIRQARHTPISRPTPGALHQVALGAGLLSSVVYVAIDLVSAARYPGYSLLHQAISELSAIGAPEASARLWAVLGPVYGVLFLAFAIAVRRAARGNRWLHVSGWIMVAFVLWGALWPFFPMHQRGAEMTASDIGHVVLGAGAELLILAYIGGGALAFGKRFRAYSFATMLTILATGLATFSYVDRVIAGAPTPWLGVVERVMIYAYLLWIGVLAIMLLRRGRSSGVRARLP